MIICESMPIRHELNTNWYDAVRCNKMQHDGNAMQYETVWWWWRINTIVLWCDENTIGTNRNLHEPMRTCAIQYDNAIVVHRIATYWVAADRRRMPMQMYNELIRMYNDEIQTNRNWHELIRRSAMQYDAIRIGLDSQGQYQSFEHFKTFVLACELIRSNSNQYSAVRCATNANSYWFADKICDSGTGAWVTMCIAQSIVTSLSERNQSRLSFMGSSCCVRNKVVCVLSWGTVYAFTRGSFWCFFQSLLCNLGNKHQINCPVRA